MADASSKPLRTYGRIKGRTLRAGRASLVEQTLPGLSLDLAKPLDLGDREVWVELGFGGGEHLAAQAAANPEVTILGAEPFVNGVASPSMMTIRKRAMAKGARMARSHQTTTPTITVAMIMVAARALWLVRVSDIESYAEITRLRGGGTPGTWVHSRRDAFPRSGS